MGLLRRRGVTVASASPAGGGAGEHRRVPPRRSPANPADPVVGHNCVRIAKGKGGYNLNKFEFLGEVNSAGCGVY